MEAVWARYCQPHPSSNLSAWRRRASDRGLTSFQRALVARMLCDRLLSDGAGEDDNDAQQTQSQFFAAQTLHAKCLADVHQLPPSSLLSLCGLLLSHFACHADRNARAHAKNQPALRRPIITRLSMVVLALTVHMGWTT